MLYINYLRLLLFNNQYYFRKQAQVAKAEAEKEGIIVPLTLEDYCIKTKVKPQPQEPQVFKCFYV